jgi:GGDEF domain-containing protein
VVLAAEPTPEAHPGTGGEMPWPLVTRVARSLKSSGRRSDAIGRLGAGTFAVVALDTDAGQARQLANRLCGAIVPSSEPADTGFHMHAGCHGVSDFHAASIDAVELMFRATAALRQARTDPAGGWLRDFEDSEPGSQPA